MRIGIPEATLIVTLTALGLQILSNVVIRTLVDLRKEKRLRNEVAAFDKELREAISKKDKDKEEKLRKKKPQVDKMRLQASTGRLKATFITYIPFIVVYYLMGDFVSGCNFPSICISSTVAYSPVPIPVIVGASGSVALFWWYSLSSFSLTFALQKILGTSMSL
ncbi:MAG: EMC3/TMCO1 family protein [Thaumarchaeota archaeon]|nr:EMC3/TMCO1 family protein [Nitrososphaerota archaeon]